MFGLTLCRFISYSLSLPGARGQPFDDAATRCNALFLLGVVGRVRLGQLGHAAAPTHDGRAVSLVFKMVSALI